MKKGRNPKPFLWHQVHKLTPAMGVYAKKRPVSRQYRGSTWMHARQMDQ